MTAPFSVKLKSKKGQFVVNNLKSSTTIGHLKRRVAAITQVEESQLNILIGFPPRRLDLTRNDITLASLGINSAETLIVEMKAPQSVSPKQRSLEDDEALARRLQAEEAQLHQAVAERTDPSSLTPENMPDELPSTSRGNFIGTLIKKPVPADNSCLFTSIRFVLNGKIPNEGSEMMRHIIAQEVAADPEEYNDAVLGKSNAKYCAWIQRPDSWGGAIEISILSNYYGIEIDVVDIQNGIINRFGEDKNYSLRVFLVFDGLHYDPLYMETDMEFAPATIFPVEDIEVYQQAEQLANESKFSRRLASTVDCNLRCLQCDKMFMGEAAAQQHFKATGHNDFDEI